MSCYEWESGTIVIPKAEWPTFRKALIGAWNAFREQDFESALAALAKMEAAAKGLREENRKKAEETALEAFCGLKKDQWGYPTGSEANQERYHRLEKLLYVRESVVGASWRDPLPPLELKTPKKKDLGILPLTGDASIPVSGGRIRLKNESHSVEWSVDENNHACEYARKDPMAELLFGLLAKITWTRGSGGKIVGNDEYSRDSRDEGGGGNFVKEEYSASTQKRASEIRKSNYGYGGRW